MSTYSDKQLLSMIDREINNVDILLSKNPSSYEELESYYKLLLAERNRLSTLINILVHNIELLEKELGIYKTEEEERKKRKEKKKKKEEEKDHEEEAHEPHKRIETEISGGSPPRIPGSIDVGHLQVLGKRHGHVKRSIYEEVSM